VPVAYDADFTAQQAMDAVVRSANRTLVLVSGGSMAGDDAMLEKVRMSAEAGVTGLIFGRNIWQRGHDESLKFATKIQEILAKYPCHSIENFPRRHRSFGESMLLQS
jgi:class I fructose-bisphosphate aldolase